MTNIIRQTNNSEYSVSDTRANSPALFGPVSEVNLTVKLELGGDFQKLTTIR